MSTSILECNSIFKSYSEGPQQVDVLRGVDLILGSGEHIAVVGASGSGKSTLLNVLGGLDKPDSGEVRILDTDFSLCGENKRGDIRNKHLGFVYQFHHLLPEFSAVENVGMPLLIAGRKKTEARQQALSMLEKVGLEQRAEHKPAELSGGERQRVAIARALVNAPACVMMDEPTGNLDEDNALSIQKLMQNLSDTLHTSFIVVTHDMTLARTMNKVYRLEQGRLDLI